MTSNINIGELARIAKEALDARTNGQEFMLNDVYNVTRAAYERHPEDHVIRHVAATIERMYERSKVGATINQSEISKIYNHFASLSGNSNFKSVLGHLLLGDVIKKSSPDYDKINKTAQEDLSIDTQDVRDASAAIQTMFVDTTNNVYDKKIASDGVKIVSAELRALGVPFHSVSVVGGDNKLLVYSSQFDTRKGPLQVAIPVEIKNNQVLFPTKFVENGQLTDLTTNNIRKHIDRFAENNEFYVDRQFPESKPDINTHSDVEMPKSLEHLARDFEDSVIEAASSFGLGSIQCGKEMVGRELRSAGFKNAQVKFGSESADSVVYLASIPTPKGAVEIEVPVEMIATAENKFSPLIPTYFAYDGIIEDFTAAKLQRFAINLPTPSTENKIYRSAFAYMTLPELKDEILKAASANDYVSCEAALSEIEEKFSEEDFKNAVADYHYILMHKTHSEHSEMQKCSRMIPAGKGSIYPRCGHYLVAMNKVVVDENGNCHLKSSIEREKLNPAEDGGAAISTSKIFMA